MRARACVRAVRGHDRSEVRGGRDVGSFVRLVSSTPRVTHPLRRRGEHLCARVKANSTQESIISLQYFLAFQLVNQRKALVSFIRFSLFSS